MTTESFYRAKEIIEEIAELQRYDNTKDHIISIEYKDRQNFLHLKVSNGMSICIEEAINKRLEYLYKELEKL